MTQTGLPQRLRVNLNCDWKLCVLTSALLGGALLCWSVMWAGPKLTLAVAIVAFLLPIMVAYAAMKDRGLVDATALFPSFFGAYNGIPLLRFLSDDFRQHLDYPVRFEPDIYFRAGLMSALGAIFIAIAWALSRPSVCKKVPESTRTGWFTVGTIFYAFGILFYLLQYSQLGGYWAALGIERTKRFELMAANLSFPYYGFVMFGLVMTMTAANRTRKRTAAIVMTALWCLMVIVAGDRRLLIQAILAVMSAAAFLATKPIKMKMKHLLFAVVAYIALSMIGALREKIPQLLSHDGSQHKIFNPSENHSLLDSITPGNSELLGPYFSVLYNAEYVREYSLGTSYAQTVFAVFPRLLVGLKPLSPSAELDNRVNRGGILGFAVIGWGYSPIAEAFLNFGLPGVCVVSSLWMGAFIGLSRLRNHAWGMVTAAVLSPESLNVNRIDFRTVYLESFSCLVVVILAAVIVKYFYRLSPLHGEKKNEARRAGHVSSATVMPANY